MKLKSTVCTDPDPDDVCQYINRAAQRGHLECLRYLHENGCPCNEQAIDVAVGRGHLECLRFLHEKGCPLTVWTIAWAAAGGHLECLRYLHESGCLWDEGVWATYTYTEPWYDYQKSRREHVQKGTPPPMIKLRPSEEYLLDNDAPLPLNLEVRKLLLATPAGIRQLARKRERQQAERARQHAVQQAERERQHAAQQAERERQQATLAFCAAAQQPAQQATLSDGKKAFLAGSGEKPLSYVRAKVTLQAERERQQAAQQADLLLQVTTGDIKQALHLVRNGETDLTLTNGDEETALHLASRLGQRGVLLALLKAGADPNCINIHGDRPEDLAKDAATRKCFSKNPFMPADSKPDLSPSTQHCLSSNRAPILTKLEELASWSAEDFGKPGTFIALKWLLEAFASDDSLDQQKCVTLVQKLAADESERLRYLRPIVDQMIERLGNRP
jgi:ankyrin repeat protein